MRRTATRELPQLASFPSTRVRERPRWLLCENDSGTRYVPWRTRRSGGPSPSGTASGKEDQKCAQLCSQSSSLPHAGGQKHRIRRRRPAPHARVVELLERAAAQLGARRAIELLHLDADGARRVFTCALPDESRRIGHGHGHGHGRLRSRARPKIVPIAAGGRLPQRGRGRAPVVSPRRTVLLRIAFGPSPTQATLAIPRRNG
jgi:hypothetical protein